MPQQPDKPTYEQLEAQVASLTAVVAHAENELRKADARVAELEEAKTRQAQALKAANQAKRAAELAAAAVTLVADPGFDHTAKPTMKAKDATLAVPPAALKHLNPETVVSIEDGQVTATVRALS